MRPLADSIEFIRRRDWRIWFGLVITFLWIAAGVWYANRVYQDNPEQLFTLESLGSFLEGAFAPLAFLWLVLGLFIQQKELARHADELRRTTEQSEKQTRAIAATELNARQETFYKIADNVKHQLGGITGMLLMSALGPLGSGKIDRGEMDEYFRKAATGDQEIFARQLLSVDYLEEGGLTEFLYGTEIRQRHARNFRRTFGKLRKLAMECDVDGIIVESLDNTAFGLLYSRMEKYRPAAGSAG
jgi:hypothetical protein